MLNNLFFMLPDPLEQFSILPIFFIYKNTLALSNFSFYVIVICLLISFVFFSLKQWPFFKKNLYNFFFVKLISFVNDTTEGKIHHKVIIAQPWFAFIFLFILFSNLLGLIPFSFTITSSLCTTFFLALTYFIGLNLIAIHVNETLFLKNFVPNGTPLAIVPFIIIIEKISYIARVFSLAIRLFANLMSGHTLLHILISVACAFFTFNLNKTIFVLIPWSIIFIISFLETVIGCMQAYVFLVLLTLYFNDSFGH